MAIYSCNDVEQSTQGWANDLRMALAVIYPLLRGILKEDHS
jgi:hypothetical protein